MQLNSDDRSLHINTANLVVIGDHTSIQPTPPAMASREDLIAAIRRANALLRGYPNTIAGVPLERAEVGQIVEWVTNSEATERLAMLFDQPGAGKTVVMRDVLERLEAQGLPVLAIKADMLSGIRGRQDLADRLGIPVPLEECTQELIGDVPFVVILDQLDALSLSLTRDQETLDVMLDTIARLREMAGVRILASCRAFDLHNDPRLASIKVDKEFRLQPLNENQVGEVLQALGVDASHLLPAHKELLSVPLHLDIYARVIKGRQDSATESFGSLQELYQALWRRIVDAVPSGRISHNEKVSDAIYHLVDAMQVSRQTSAPEGVLDAYPESTRHLLRESFIRLEGARLVFLHQTLFDYCYARRFVAQGRSIADEVLSGPQGLFERSQMVQILAYLRGADSAAYHQELTRLLFDQRMRVHLRLLLIGWIGALRDPTADELRLARRLIGNPSDRGFFVNAIRGNPGWFDALKNRTVPSLLESTDDQVVELVIYYLSSMIDVRTTGVVRLLRPYLARSETWDARVAYCVSLLDNWEVDEAADVLCDLIRRGRGLERATLAFYKLAQTNPAAGCRVLEAYLDRRLDDLIEQYRQESLETTPGPNGPSYASLGERPNWSHQLFKEHGIARILDLAVQACPEKIIQHLLPWFVRAAATLRRWDQTPDSYPTDFVFSWGWYGEHVVEGALFAVRMSEAIQRLATSDPVAFRHLAGALSRVELYAVQRVLVQGYLADPPAYADDIFAYLIDDARRLNLGEVLGSTRYDSCRLFGAAFQNVDAEHRAELERLVLDPNPAWDKWTLRTRESTQLHFLKSVPRELLSLRARGTLEEIERKFPGFEPKPPEGIDFRTVEAPIDQAGRARLSDDEWLEAMRRYDDSTDWDAVGQDPSKGGVVELSRSFQEHVKQDPERFYRLALRFDDTISAAYWAAATSGLAEASAPAKWLFDLVHRLPTKLGEHLRAVCWALQKRSADGVPDDILDMITQWALHDPDPQSEMWSVLSSSGQSYYQGDPLSHGINTNRGAAVMAASQCALARKPPQIERFFNLLEQAALDQSTAVRACVVRSLGPMLGHDQVRTLAIFGRAMDGHPRLLDTRAAHDFLYWTYYKWFPRTRPFIEAMLDSQQEDTRQAGARLACLAAFRYEDAAEMEARAMGDDPVMRRGAAQIYAANLGISDARQVCQERLLVLMHDTNEQVRAHVGECFRHVQPESLEDLRAFIETFLDSPAAVAGAEHLIAFIASVAFDEPELALHVTERILDRAGAQVVDIRTSWAILERDLARLPLTVYTHTPDPSLKSRSMDLFERFLLMGSREANRALEDWDRR